MQFTVPQFIEHEPKILGPLTLKQFAFIGTAGAICFFLYFLAPFPVFLIACFFIGGGGTALALLKIGGRSLPLILADFLKFNVKPKIYIWEKKEQPEIKVYKVYERKKENEEGDDKLPLKVADKSLLNKTHSKIETKLN